MANMDYPAPCWTCSGDDSCVAPVEDVRDEDHKVSEVIPRRIPI